MRVFRFAMATVLALSLAGSVAAGTRLRVTGDSVALRPRGDLRSEALEMMPLGQVLEAVEWPGEGEWVQVRPPASLSAWISAELVDQDVVIVNKARIRGGPSLNYKDIGMLVKGDRVEVRGKTGDWLQIAPPSSASVWISRQYVTPVGAPAAATPVKVEPPAPPPVPPAPPVVRADSAPFIDPPASVFAPVPPEAVEGRRETTPRQDRPAVAAAAPAAAPKPAPAPAPRVKAAPHAAVEREVRQPAAKPAPSPRTVTRTYAETRPGASSRRSASRPTRREVITVSSANASYTGEIAGTQRFSLTNRGEYRLVRRDTQGRALTLCFLSGPPERFEALRGTTVRAIGTETWNTGARYPTLQVDSIVRVPVQE
jgi:hypothetical protein